MEVKSDMTAEINEALQHNEIVGAVPEKPADAPAPPVVAGLPPGSLAEQEAAALAGRDEGQVQPANPGPVPPKA